MVSSIITMSLFQTAPSQTPPSKTSIVGPPSSHTSRQRVIFNEFLKWYKDRQISSSPSVALTGTSFTGLTHSTSLGPWVLDSGVIDHVTGNKSIFLFPIYYGLFTFGYHGQWI